MDGRGRAFDNLLVERLWRSVKHEDVYPKGYATVGELMIGLIEYFAFYNGERPHQSLGHKTPDVVYQTAMGGGAMILDKYPRSVEEPTVPLRAIECSSTATARSDTSVINEENVKPGGADIIMRRVNMGQSTAKLLRKN